MLIFKTPVGDSVHRYQKAIVIPFTGRRGVVSTSVLNGGYHIDLEAVYNRDENLGAGIGCKLRAATYEEHLRLIGQELGLNPEKITGLSTAASMDNLSIIVERSRELSVTAIVTGGVEVNGGRAGDKASYDELDLQEKQKLAEKSGTINIIVEINANLPPGTLTRALVTCTEAKTAALQELIAGSNYSTGLATGSGTDGTIMICNLDSHIYLTNAGKHSKLGELIGKAVKGAVKEALDKQTGLSPQKQHSLLRRFKRYGLNEESLWISYLASSVANEEDCLPKTDFMHRLDSLEIEGKWVTAASLYIHLLDQYQWGLLNDSELREGGKLILTDLYWHLESKEQLVMAEDCEDLITELITDFEKVILTAIKVEGEVKIGQDRLSQIDLAAKKKGR